jgi:hypothetical protein
LQFAAKNLKVRDVACDRRANTVISKFCQKISLTLIFLSPSVKFLGNGIKEIWQNFSQSGKYCQNHSKFEEKLISFKNLLAIFMIIITFLIIF